LPVWWLLLLFSVLHRVQLLQIEQQSRELAAVLDNAFQLVGKISTQGVVLLANARALAFSGEGSESDIGKLFWETRWWSHSPALQTQIREAVQSAAAGAFVRFKTSHLDADGEIRTFDFSLRPMLDEQGEVTALIAEGRDITELEQAQAERQRLREELLQSQKLEIVGRLASGVAHDFNNLLTVVMGNTDFLRSECPNNPEVRAALEAMDTVVEQGESVARSLLSFARPSKPKRERVDLEHAIADVARLLQRILPKSISLEVEIPPGVEISVDGDPTQIQQLLMNLSINARDAMPGGGHLSIGLARRPAPSGKKKEAVVTVRDTGVGIPPELATRVFEPFFTTKGDAGTGLGLAVVQTIVANHGARLALDSEPGHGTAFSVAFPLGAISEPSIEISLDRVPLGSGERLLLVEDNAPLRELMARNLRDRGYEISAVADGESALELLHPRAEFSLVISDIDLPNLDGISLMHAARERGLDLPFVLISGRSADFSPRIDEQVAVLSKPFRPAELAWTVCEALAYRQQRGGLG